MLASRSSGLTLWKTVWRFLKKLGIKAPYDPAIPLLGIHPEETKTEYIHLNEILHRRIGHRPQGFLNVYNKNDY